MEEYVNDISITPLGIPMIAGPGAITNAIVLMGDAPDYTTKLMVVISILLVALVILVSLLGASAIIKFIGDQGTKILTKLMGLIVMVIAVEFFFAGITPYVQAMLK